MLYEQKLKYEKSNMEELSAPVIVAIITALTALFAPLVRSYLERGKSEASISESEANAASVLTGAYKNLLDDLQQQLDSQGKKIERLTVRVKDLENENLVWQREYRVLWDGAKRNARQIIELGEIPVFDPPANTFRGKLSYGDKDDG